MPCFYRKAGFGQAWSSQVTSWCQGANPVLAGLSGGTAGRSEVLLAMRIMPAFEEP